MRAQFLLIPAALVAGAEARAEIYLSFEQAQQLLFPGATFTPQFRSLTDEQIEAITREAEATVWERKVKVWKVSTGGWLFLDQVVGRDDWISYAIALDDKGTVLGIEILECLERWNQIILPEWRAQFKGKRRAQMVKSPGIEIISSTTLSSIHVIEGVKRILSTFALVVAPAKQG